MTSRERLLCAFACGTPDRVPVAPFGFGHVNPDSEVGYELVRKTDFIQSVGGAGGWFLGAGVEQTVVTEGQTTTITYHTPKGDLTQVNRSTDITHATVKFPCRDADDIEKVLSIPYEPIAADPRPFVEWEDRLGDEGLTLVGFLDAICAPAMLFSPEDFSLLWVDAPDAFMALIQAAQERCLQAAEDACRAGIKGFRIIGGEYASTQLGPYAYRQTVTEPDAELVKLMHDHGAIVYYHNHGPVMKYLEMFADIGMDAADCFEAPPWGDCDLVAAKEVLKGRVCIVGNLDDMEVIDKLDEATVRAIARERLEQAGPDGFVLGGTASGTYTERGARNFIAMAEVSREL
ncbi:MAG: hypothetical protein HPY69_02690 [Armatimonadetes bacterium]|nr:hypothetical protein [Armatimonadota bacterium]